jgi:hypothetical protein
MKKLIIFIVAFMLSLNLTFSQREKTQQRTSNDDPVTIKVEFQDKVRVTRSEQRAYNELLSYISSQQAVDESKQQVDSATIETLGIIIESIPELVGALRDRPKAYYSRQDYLYREWAVSSMDLLGMIEKENKLYGLGDLWTFLIGFSGLGIILVQLYRRNDWRALLIMSTCLTLVTYVLWQVLPVILSQLFNSEYNVIKALL